MNQVMRFAATSVFICFTLSVSKADDLIVQLPDGKIQGRILKSLNDSDYYSFQGIPYAAPPIGANRFKEPKDPQPWDGVLDTRDNRKMCIQIPLWTVSDVPMNQTEDCLYAHVFTPVKPGSVRDLLPVLVWIHGGGFMAGSGTFYSTGPKWFMDYGIVIVSINYRLGPLGFLSTMDGVVPGNLGLKDQRQALRWIHKNIQFFGGDPTKVTIAGESAGAASVGFHLLGLNEKGLFRGSIQESGTSMCRIAYTENAKIFAYQLGHLLDGSLMEKNSTTELLAVLQKASGEDIIGLGPNVTNTGLSAQGFCGDSVWTAVFEKENESLDPFITAPMYQSFLNGEYNQVPSLTGFNSEEALGFAGKGGCYFGKSYDDNPALMVSPKLNIRKEDYEAVGTALKEIYTNTSFENDLAACIKYSTDMGFAIPIIRQAEVMAKYVPVYLYQFSYAGKLGAPNGRHYVPGVEAVIHAEDLKYLWEFGYGGDIPPEDLKTVQRFHTLWTNFVKYLNPTPEKDDLLDNVIWPKVVPDTDIQYFNFNKTLEVKTNPRYYRKVNPLFQKYQQPPFVTY